MAWALHEGIMNLDLTMKKPYILIASALILIGFLAFTGTGYHPHNDQQIKNYDVKIEKLKSEISELNKSGNSKAAILDSLLRAI